VAAPLLRRYHFLLLRPLDHPIIVRVRPEAKIKERITFVLGHALYLKAIHGGKAKNDKIDDHKLAVIWRGDFRVMV
jgi:hypothetical protein